jgi:hypothetical protein
MLDVRRVSTFKGKERTVSTDVRQVQAEAKQKGLLALEGQSVVVRNLNKAYSDLWVFEPLLKRHEHF